MVFLMYKLSVWTMKCLHENCLTTVAIQPYLGANLNDMNEKFQYVMQQF